MNRVAEPLFGVKEDGALTIAVSLAQIGEFSFILADLNVQLGLMSEEARALVLGASILSIFLNPLLFALLARREEAHHVPDRPRPAPEPTALKDHVVLVGFGRVGHLIADGIKYRMPLLVVEEGVVGDPGIEHIRGNAARDDVLAATNLKEAKLLFVAIPQAFEAGQIVQQARRANPELPIVARAHFDAEVQHLAGLVGIENVRSGASPEEKLAIVRAEAAKGSTLFLGDGINDAPAMEAATVGVAFGHNSDITAEAADAVVLDQSLASVDELIHIGRRMRRIALQSAVGGMTLSMIGMLAAAAGWLAPVPGAVAQEVIDVLAVLNALRVAAARRELSDLNG